MCKSEQLALTVEFIDERTQLVEQLMHDYSDHVLHLVYTYVKNQTTAEDLTQEIFIKCYEKLDQFKQQSSLKTWLYRIASNHCKDYLKSWHYRKIMFNEKVLNSLPSKAKQIEEEIIAKDEEHRLAYAVLTLPLKYREVVFLHFYEELSLADINKITAVNTNTLKTRLKRAKQLIKSKLNEEE